MILFSFIACALVLAYTGIICARHGIPNSISATWYTIEHKGWFAFVMIATALCLLVGTLDATPSNYQWMLFLAAVGMFMVASAPNFRSDDDRMLHTVGAVFCIFFSQTWIACTTPALLTMWLLYFGGTIYGLKKQRGIGSPEETLVDDFLATKPLFWIEIITFSTALLNSILLNSIA